MARLSHYYDFLVVGLVGESTVQPRRHPLTTDGVGEGIFYLDMATAHDFQRAFRVAFVLSDSHFLLLTLGACFVFASFLVVFPLFKPVK
jgi:hypothetical protein